MCVFVCVCVCVFCINRHIGQWKKAKMIQRVISTNGRNVMLSLAIILYLRVPIGAIGWDTALQA